MPTLHWLNKEEAVKKTQSVPFRLLESEPETSYGDPNAQNMLVQGDNLDALKALLPFYAGKVKCIYIDPPYNTQNAFEHYEDNLEHSVWLSMMYPRLELLRELLSENGSIWISIDDEEGHYLKVIMDEIFGRKNFFANIVWQSKDTPGNNSSGIAQTHNHVIVYQKTHLFNPNLLERNEKQLLNYKNPDDDLRGVWLATPLTRTEHRDRDYYPLLAPDGHEVLPPKGSSWRHPPPTMIKLQNENRIWWGKNGKAEFPMEKKFLSEVKAGVVNQSWWTYDFAGSTRNASAELKGIFDGSKVFDTPKPEKLIFRILNLATQVDDLILDSFLGSGTTAAVAHKMNRRYIGIEMGEHAITHCIPRLKKVIDGEQGGISKAVNWQGGGGFRFYRLGEPIFDESGKIHPNITFDLLAAHIWFSETGTPLLNKPDTPLIGIYKETAYYLLFNGILGDRRPQNGNVLTSRVFGSLPAYDGAKVIYGESSRFGEQRLKSDNITFKQIPYDVRAR